MMDWPHTRRAPIRADWRNNGWSVNGLSFLRRLGLIRRWIANREIRNLLQAGLFDRAFYLSANPDVEAAGIDPLEHYVRWGKREGRKPFEHFDQGAFSRCIHADNPTRAQIKTFCAKMGLPVRHPEEILGFPGLMAAAHDPDFDRIYTRVADSGLFDAEFYRRQVPVLGGVDPLAHYLLWGHRAFLDPSPMFSGAEYHIVNADAQSAGMNPIVHWLEYGRPAGRPMSISEREAQRGRTARFSVGLSLPEQIQLEAMKGTAYLGRYGFTLDKTSSLKHAAQAIGDLAAGKPKLNTNSTTPDVSIIIPVYGQLQILLNCLDLLANQESRYRVRNSCRR